MNAACCRRPGSRLGAALLSGPVDFGCDRLKTCGACRLAFGRDRLTICDACRLALLPSSRPTIPTVAASLGRLRERETSTLSPRLEALGASQDRKLDVAPMEASLMAPALFASHDSVSQNAAASASPSVSAFDPIQVRPV